MSGKVQPGTLTNVRRSSSVGNAPRVSFSGTATMHVGTTTTTIPVATGTPEYPAWAIQAAQATGKTPDQVLAAVTAPAAPVAPVVPDWVMTAAAATGKTPDQILQSLGVGGGSAIVPAGSAVVPVTVSTAGPARRNAQMTSPRGQQTQMSPQVRQQVNQQARTAGSDYSAVVRQRSAGRNRPTGQGSSRIAQLATPRPVSAAPARLRHVDDIALEEDPQGMKTRHGGAFMTNAVADYFHTSLRRDSVVAADKGKRIVKAAHGSGLDNVKFGFDPRRQTIVHNSSHGVGVGGVGAINHQHTKVPSAQSNKGAWV